MRVMRHLKVLVCSSVMIIALAGCGSGSSAPEPAPDPTPEIETWTGDLSDYVSGSLTYVQAFSEGYSVPSASALSFSSCCCICSVLIPCRFASY
jgi:hypothetical protein